MPRPGRTGVRVRAAPRAPRRACGRKEKQAGAAGGGNGTGAGAPRRQADARGVAHKRRALGGNNAQRAARLRFGMEKQCLVTGRNRLEGVRQNISFFLWHGEALHFGENTHSLTHSLALFALPQHACLPRLTCRHAAG